MHPCITTSENVRSHTQCTSDEEHRVAAGTVYEAMSVDQAKAVRKLDKYESNSPVSEDVTNDTVKRMLAY